MLEGKLVDGVVIRVGVVIAITILGNGNLQGVTELDTITAGGVVNTTVVHGDDELLVLAAINDGLNDVVVHAGDLVSELLGVLLDDVGTEVSTVALVGDTLLNLGPLNDELPVSTELGLELGLGGGLNYVRKRSATLAVAERQSRELAREHINYIPNGPPSWT